jgi:hypothetical protein
VGGAVGMPKPWRCPDCGVTCEGTPFRIKMHRRSNPRHLQTMAELERKRRAEQQGDLFDDVATAYAIDATVTAHRNERGGR